MNLAKAVANAAAMLVLKAKNVAQVAEDTVLQNRVIAAATQCALSTSQLVACAKVQEHDPKKPVNRKPPRLPNIHHCYQAWHMRLIVLNDSHRISVCVIRTQFSESKFSGYYANAWKWCTGGLMFSHLLCQICLGFEYYTCCGVKISLGKVLLKLFGWVHDNNSPFAVS